MIDKQQMLRFRQKYPQKYQLSNFYELSVRNVLEWVRAYQRSLRTAIFGQNVYSGVEWNACLVISKSPGDFQITWRAFHSTPV